MISSAVIGLIQINKLTSSPNLFSEGINAADLLAWERIPRRCFHTSAIFLPDIALQVAGKAIMSTLASGRCKKTVFRIYLNECSIC